ncbi:kinase, putative [Ricinus communis]|uniref:Kinase, putative n=1 Tax=Ricinus communis TaxID=3988 RepID=B9RM91_RICCO|nr:kinase, putative [Ricinus communis]
MDLSSFCCFFIFLFLFVIHQPSNCQQDYLNNTQLNCGVNPSISKGYLCNGNDQVPCQSYITFLSLPPYDTPISIAYVLGSIYQHNTPYTIKNLTESYFTIANNTYQGLTTCQALTGQNYYDPEHLQVGMELMVPLRCACPSRNQTADGVISLLMYMVTWGDTLSSIGQAFGADAASILEANRLSQNSIIFPFTPILVPLRRERCMADPENFFCQCPKGGVGGLNCRQDSKKFPTKLIILLGTGIGMGLLCLFLFSYKLFHFLKERRNRIRKERLFEQNGGFLLQQKLSSCGGGKKAKLFTAEELQRATDNYNQSRFLGQGGYGTVFKGMLPDGSIVAVKRSKTIDRTQIAQFINEVVILSQINHRNIVKLLGCCLETELPLLVYEFIPNGNLSNHIHEQDQESSFPWELRLRIASEVAGAVAYMHSSASSPIFHRDIKSSNILLDDKYSAKVSDFGTSRAIPFDRTHLTTAVQGTFGNEDERSLVAHFISSMKEDRLLQILDPRVAREARREDMHAIAKLATSCVRLNGKKRPTMREVAMELDGLRKSERCLQIDQELSLLRDDPSFAHRADEPGQESTEDYITFSLEMESTSF